MKTKRKRPSSTVLITTKFSDPNDGIRMTDWEFKEYVAAWLRKSMILKIKNESSKTPPTTNDDGPNVESRVRPSNSAS